MELLHLLFNLTTLWSIGDFEARRGFDAKGVYAYYVQMSIILLLLSGVVSTFQIHSLLALYKAWLSGSEVTSTD